MKAAVEKPTFLKDGCKKWEGKYALTLIGIDQEKSTKALPAVQGSLVTGWGLLIQVNLKEL